VLTDLQAVVETAEKAVEQVPLSGGVSVASVATTIVVATSAWRQTQRGEGPELAHSGQAVVLDRSMQDENLLAQSAGDRRCTRRRS
jgi:hypothetical protein